MFHHFRRFFQLQSHCVIAKTQYLPHCYRCMKQYNDTKGQHENYQLCRYWSRYHVQFQMLYHSFLDENTDLYIWMNISVKSSHVSSLTFLIEFASIKSYLYAILVFDISMKSSIVQHTWYFSIEFISSYQKIVQHRNFCNVPKNLELWH